MINQSNRLYVQTDEQGRLILSPEVAAGYGIKPNSRLMLEKDSFNNGFPTCGGCFGLKALSNARRDEEKYHFSSIGGRITRLANT
jgi:hypothetical protein